MAKDFVYTDANMDTATKTKGFIFGVSREKFARVYVKENPPYDPCIPGPGAYRPTTNFTQKKAGAYSMRPNTKFQSIFTDFTKEVPGPGSYEAAKASQNLNGFTVNARFKSPLAAKISPSGTRFDLTFIKKAAKEPGPGEYSPTTAGNNMYGTFFHSKNGNTGAPVFSKSKRQVVLDNSETRKITPGPGTYRF